MTPTWIAVHTVLIMLNISALLAIAITNTVADHWLLTLIGSSYITLARASLPEKGTGNNV